MWQRHVGTGDPGDRVALWGRSCTFVAGISSRIREATALSVLSRMKAGTRDGPQTGAGSLGGGLAVSEAETAEMARWQQGNSLASIPNWSLDAFWFTAAKNMGLKEVEGFTGGWWSYGVCVFRKPGCREAAESPFKTAGPQQGEPSARSQGAGAWGRLPCDVVQDRGGAVIRMPHTAWGRKLRTYLGEHTTHI